MCRGETETQIPEGLTERPMKSADRATVLSQVAAVGPLRTQLFCSPRIPRSPFEELNKTCMYTVFILTNNVFIQGNYQKDT